jgi:hypothetical protein
MVIWFFGQLKWPPEYSNDASTASLWFGQNAEQPNETDRNRPHSSRSISESARPISGMATTL